VDEKECANVERVNSASSNCNISSQCKKVINELRQNNNTLKEKLSKY
jgi:hypothetical protein